MNVDVKQAVIEALLFASGGKIELKELASILKISKDEVKFIIEQLKNEYQANSRGIQIVELDNGYQLCTKEKYYDYIIEFMDTRPKPSLSPSLLEVLSIIVYNKDVTRPQIEHIRGTSSDRAINKLLEYDLIEEKGKLEVPGRPMAYGVTEEFFRKFGISSLDDLPPLPRYVLDENRQVVLQK